MGFADRGTEDIYDGLDSKKARNALPRHLHEKAQSKLSLMAFANSLNDLRVPTSNHLEALCRIAKTNILSVLTINFGSAFDGLTKVQLTSKSPTTTEEDKHATRDQIAQAPPTDSAGKTPR